MTTYYINYNTNTGEILTRYVSDIHEVLITTPPSGTSNLEVSEDAFNLTVQTNGFTVVNGALVPPAQPTDAQLLAQAQIKQKSLIETAYQTAITVPIAYMGTTFQADNASQDILVKVLLGMQVVGSTPACFAWMDANNAAVPMTLADLQGLYGAVLTRGQAEFTKKIIAKQAVDAATTVAAVQAVTL